MNAVEENNIENSETKFTKEQILKSSRFNYIEKHVLDALLSNEEKYSLEDTKKILENFNEKEVER